MAYLCKKFRSIECIGCGDCQPYDEDESIYDDITEEDLTDEQNWYGEEDEYV